MFKVVSTELKKMVSKPGVYVLSVLLAIILVLGVFIYKPTVYEDTSVTLSGKTYIEKLYAFEGDGVTRGEKIKYDNMVNHTAIQVNSYINGGKAEVRIKGALNEFNVIFRDLYQSVSNDSNTADQAYIEASNRAMINSFNNFRNLVINGIDDATNGSYYIVTTQENYKQFNEIEKKVRDSFPEEPTKLNIERFCSDYEKNYKSKIQDCLSKLIYPTLSEEFVKQYTYEQDSKYATEKKRLNDIYAQIQKIDATANNAASEMDRLANLYISTANTYCNLVKYELLSNAFSVIPTKQQLDLQYLNTETKYNSNTQLIRFSYIFDHNAVEEQFAQPLTIGFTSNHETNAYDYAHFIMKLFSFIIIIYAIMTVCHSIAGEVKDGTMRYLAIRPVTRTSLVIGKFLAVIIMSTILIVFSGIISLLVGGAVYGFSGLKILTIFNGTTAITMHPLVMFIISLVSILIELVVYCSIATLLSCLFKSDLFAVTIMILFYLLNILLPIVVAGSANSALAYYPFVHLSIYSLFGSSIYASNTNILNMLLGVKIFANTSIWLTGSIIIIAIVVCLLVATQIFKRKEF